MSDHDPSITDQEGMAAEFSAEQQADQLFIHGLLKHARPKSRGRLDRVGKAIERLRHEEETKLPPASPDAKVGTWWLPLSILASAAAIVVSIVMVADRLTEQPQVTRTPLDALRKAIVRIHAGDHHEYRIRLKHQSKTFFGAKPMRGKLIVGQNGHFVANVKFGFADMKLGYDGADWWCTLPSLRGSRVMVSDRLPPMDPTVAKASMRRGFGPERLFSLAAVLSMPDILDLMEEDYDLKFLPNSGDSQRLSIEGSLRDQDSDLPQTIELESNAGGEILAVRYYWEEGRMHFGPKAVHLELIGKTSVPADFYRHESHHDDNANVKRVNW